MPRIPASNKVDENDAKRPDVGDGCDKRACVRGAADTFWAHVEGATTTEVRAKFGSRRQPEITQVDAVGVFGAQDIFRLQVAMIDSQIVTAVHCVEELQKGPF